MKTTQEHVELDDLGEVPPTPGGCDEWSRPTSGFAPIPAAVLSALRWWHKGASLPVIGDEIGVRSSTLQKYLSGEIKTARHRTIEIMVAQLKQKHLIEVRDGQLAVADVSPRATHAELYGTGRCFARKFPWDK